MISYNEISPSHPILQNYIECFWVFIADEDDDFNQVELNLPDGGIDLVFNFGRPYKRLMAPFKNESNSVISSSLIGQRTFPTAIVQEPERHLVAVRFRPNGLQAFCNLSLTGVTNSFLNPNDIWKDFYCLEEQLFEEETNCIEKIERWLLAHLIQPEDKILLESIKIIQSLKGNIALSNLYSYLNIDKSTLEKKFKKKVGISPKKLAAIYRFNHVVALKTFKPNLTYTQISYDCGYFDQAHLIREFKKHSGYSPTAYFNKKYRFTEIFSNGFLDGVFY